MSAHMVWWQRRRGRGGRAHPAQNMYFDKALALRKFWRLADDTACLWQLKVVAGIADLEEGLNAASEVLRIQAKRDSGGSGAGYSL